ncbi:fructosamine kinase family protein [Reichenbachiella sp.]|uniref:fructosamine kinase family protein n=1 Tax=Reichenbachiella sp. TaxID=2184521 RepID=UPI003298CA8B
MNFLREVVQQLFGSSIVADIDLTAVGGGCIHSAGVFQFENKKYFIKWNENASSMFEAEKNGLTLLSETSSLIVPKVMGRGTTERVDYLCLEYVESGPAEAHFWKIFGELLAQLHQHTSAYFGLDYDNYIGRLAQSNEPAEDWIEFFINRRLMPQLKMAQDKGLIRKELVSDFEILFNKLRELIPEEKPALLHGDLWSGNFLIGEIGRPVIFDPAIYYGHREAEIAFTRLFGGFDSEFYHAYIGSYPMQPGHEERVGIFNLYPLLVHLNLFGSAYLQEITRTLGRFT